MDQNTNYSILNNKDDSNIKTATTQQPSNQTLLTADEEEIFKLQDIKEDDIIVDHASLNSVQIETSEDRSDDENLVHTDGQEINRSHRENDQASEENDFIDDQPDNDDVNDDDVNDADNRYYVTNEIVDVNDDPVDGQQNMEENKEPKKKRGLPKAMLANQLKYLEALERQQRMINNSKKKKPTNTKNIPENIDKTVNTSNQNTEGMRRVIVAGKVKYLPIKPMDTVLPKIEDHKTSSPVKEEPKQEKIKKSKPIDIPIHKKMYNGEKHLYHELKIEPSKILELKSMHPSLLEKLVEEKPSSMSKKIEMHNANMAKHAVSNKNKTNASARKGRSEGNRPVLTGKKIPKKYAMQIENDIKKQTVKNVKNFSDLRRVKAMQDITTDTDIDANKASIAELRKLRIEQRKKELSELKKKAESNKKETAIQDILKNDKMSKFAKTVAIKNLSVNSRNRNKI